MYAGKNKSINNILKIISQDRERTNILKKQEQTALTFLGSANSGLDDFRYTYRNRIFGKYNYSVRFRVGGLFW